MTLRLWLTALIVPPVNLALLAAIGVLAGRRRWGRVLAGAAVAGLLLLAVPALADRLLLALQVRPAAATMSPGAIVILGGDLAADATSPLGAAPGGLTLARLRTGAALARLRHLPVLVSGGIVLRGAAPVASVMARSLRDDFGVVPQWTESASANTWANARDSAAILDRAGIHAVLLVTSAWHMRRALIAFAGTDIAATPAPVPDDRSLEITPSALMPDIHGWLTSYLALHEWIGCGWYLLQSRWPHG